MSECDLAFSCGEVTNWSIGAGRSGKARIMMLLPGEPLLNGVPSSKLCTSLDEIQEALDEAERVHVRSIAVPTYSLIALLYVIGGAAVPISSMLKTTAAWTAWRMSCCICTRAKHCWSCLLQEEGVILKNPDSEWKPDERRLGSWVKLKPEYTRNYEVRPALHRLYVAIASMRCALRHACPSLILAV